jgi:hypothetical protein
MIFAPEDNGFVVVTQIRDDTFVPRGKGFTSNIASQKDCLPPGA